MERNVQLKVVVKGRQSLLRSRKRLIPGIISIRELEYPDIVNSSDASIHSLALVQLTRRSGAASGNNAPEVCCPRAED
jgi:hypothetical protein